MILFLFLMNLRTTFISLTAIPLSLVATAVVFHVLGMSINTMTLGGLAVAIGELVDDAIVDLENIVRRLRENAALAAPRPAIAVVRDASQEVRGAVIWSTVIIALVFVPLFALGGMEGKLFVPLGVAYIVSIIASLVVSLTVTPVLSYWLLPNAKFMADEKDGLLLRFLKRIGGSVIRLSVRHPWPILIAVLAAVFIAAAGTLLLLVLVGQLTYLQVIHADKLDDDPRNNRAVLRDTPNATGLYIYNQQPVSANYDVSSTINTAKINKYSIRSNIFNSTFKYLSFF